MRARGSYTKQIIGTGKINVDFSNLSVIKVGIITTLSDAGKALTIKSKRVYTAGDEGDPASCKVLMGKTGMLEYQCEDNSHYTDDADSQDSNQIEDGGYSNIPNVEYYKIYIQSITSEESFYSYCIDYIVEGQNQKTY